MAVVLLGGCGTRVAAPAERVRWTTETFLSLCAEDDARGAMTLLTAPTEKRFLEGASTLDSCDRVLGLRLPLDDPSQAEETLRAARVTRTSVKGDVGSAGIEASGATSRLDAALVRGSWRLAGAPVETRR